MCVWFAAPDKSNNPLCCTSYSPSSKTPSGQSRPARCLIKGYSVYLPWQASLMFAALHVQSDRSQLVWLMFPTITDTHVTFIGLCARLLWDGETRASCPLLQVFVKVTHSLLFKRTQPIVFQRETFSLSNLSPAVVLIDTTMLLPHVTSAAVSTSHRQSLFPVVKGSECAALIQMKGIYKCWTVFAVNRQWP